MDKFGNSNSRHHISAPNINYSFIVLESFSVEPIILFLYSLGTSTMGRDCNDFYRPGLTIPSQSFSVQVGIVSAKMCPEMEIVDKLLMWDHSNLLGVQEWEQ